MRRILITRMAGLSKRPAQDLDIHESSRRTSLMKARRAVGAAFHAADEIRAHARRMGHSPRGARQKNRA
jgi:hypothetical protein